MIFFVFNIISGLSILKDEQRKGNTTMQIYQVRCTEGMYVQK